jgi:hypothetical protein
MTQTQSGSDIGEAVQQIPQNGNADGRGLGWLLQLSHVTSEQQRTGTHLSEYPALIQNLQRRVQEAGFSAEIKAVKNAYGHPLTHESGAVRKAHLVVLSGDFVLDPYCTKPMPVNEYLEKVYHSTHQAQIVH